MNGYYIFTSIIGAAGIFLLICWLAQTAFGLKSLILAPPRRNSMPYYLPFIVLFCWLSLYAVSFSLIESWASKMPGWQQKFAAYAVLILIEVIFAVFIILSMRKYFEAGLSGFGFRLTGIFRDFAAGAAIFLASWPLVFFMLTLVLNIGRFFSGPDFKIEQNEGLTVLLGYDSLSLKILMIFFAAVLTPAFEEIVFRGILQTYLRNLDYGPWQSIFICSTIFSVLHPLTHFPAIFVLSAAMGYAYEKSGSLFRPIFIHILFNGLTIVFALTNSNV
jgi:membrane protease YdiL (CAAX protease family)